MKQIESVHRRAARWIICRFIHKETCHHSVGALITSRLDYCNAVFTLLSSKDINRLQRLQNCAARLVFAVGQRIEAQTLLQTLHWLPMQQRIVFKVLLYVNKQNQQTVCCLNVPPRALRSAMDINRLVVPRSNLVIGDHSFTVAAAKAWNSLPLSIRTANSVETFKSNLKGALDKFNIIPNFFPKKVGIFIALEVLAWVKTVCRVLHYRLTYFWRNMNISSIFYFSKSTSINTQYSSLWGTLKMMLFTKYLIKWKRIGRISWNFRYWFDFKSSIELDIKRHMLYLSNAPLRHRAPIYFNLFVFHWTL